MMKPDTPIADLVKIHFVVLGFLALFVGIVSTEFYYHALGLRYQAASLSVDHLVYRGLSLLVGNPFLLLPYLLAAVLLSVEERLLRHSRYRIYRTFIVLVVVALIAALAYGLARYVGLKEAEVDSVTSTSRLVEIAGGASAEIPDLSGYRIVVRDSDYLYVIKPQDIAASKPKLWLLKKDGLKSIQLSTAQ